MFRFTIFVAHRLQRNEEQLNECQTSKQDANEDYWRDQLLVNSLVSSAVAKGLCKATEQEKEEAIARMFSNLEAVIKAMGSELHRRWVKSDCIRHILLFISEIRFFDLAKNKDLAFNSCQKKVINNFYCLH